MRSIVRKWIPVFIATGTSLFVLVGYLVPISPLSYYRDYLIEWAIIVAAFAFVLGLANLLRVHGHRIVRSRPGWPYSLVLLLVALVAWIPPVLYGPSGEMTQQMLEYVIGPVGAALAALLVFTLTLSAFRLLRERRSGASFLFILIVAIVLLGNTPVIGFGWLNRIRDWIINVPGMAGMRGLLLGVALGTIITGLRVIMAIDQPHSEF